LFGKYSESECAFFEINYTCPLPNCGKSIQGGYDGFTEHIYGFDHASEAENLRLSVNCPICATRPGGNTTYQSIDIYGHWKASHGMHSGGNQDEKLRWYCPDQEQMARNIVLT